MFQYALYAALQEKGLECNIDDSYKHGKGSSIVERSAQLHTAFGLNYKKYNNAFDAIPAYEYKGGLIERIQQEYYVYLVLPSIDRLIGRFIKKYRRISILSYFQDSRIFSKRVVSERLRKDFSCPKERKQKEAFRKWKEAIERVPSASVHVRRTDYLSREDHARLYGGICTEEYYKKAVELILEKEPNTVFFIFSDDKEYVKEHYNDERFIVVDDDGLDDIDEFFLISECRHHILANSTYSWWSAWLDDNEEAMIIAPEKWLNRPHQPHLHTKKMTVVSCGGGTAR